jgi:hypothetical protein
VTDTVALLRSHLEHTGTAFHSLAGREEIGSFLAQKLGLMGVRSVLAFPEEIPGGEELAGSWGSEAGKRIPFTVRFSPAELSGDAGARFIAGFDACVTGCHSLVAEGGICVFDSAAPSGRLASLLPPHHIVVAARDCLVGNLTELMEKRGMGQGCSTIFVSGPSRTADIEKELVIGVHGPLTLTVILVP